MPPEDPILAETGRRLWYAVYLSDIVSALGLNRAPSIPTAVSEPDAPCSDSEWEKEYPILDSRPSRAIIFDSWDANCKDDGTLDTEWSRCVAGGRAIDEVLDGLHRYLKENGVELFAPRNKDARWKAGLERFFGVAAYLERVWWRLPSWIRELDADPMAFVRKTDKETVELAKALYTLSIIHAAWACLYSPPTPAMESRETQVWLAHGQGTEGLPGGEGPEELRVVRVSPPASVAGLKAFAGFPVQVDVDGNSVICASPASLCFFHQRRRAGLTPAILAVDPDTTYRNGIAGILASQLFMLRLLLRGMYVEHAVAELLAEAAESGREMDAETAKMLLESGKQRGLQAAKDDFAAHLIECEPSAKQNRAGAAAMMIARVMVAVAHEPPPGVDDAFAGVKFSSFGALGGEFRDGFMTLLLNGPDKPDPGVKEAHDGPEGMEGIEVHEQGKTAEPGEGQESGNGGLGLAGMAGVVPL